MEACYFGAIADEAAIDASRVHLCDREDCQTSTGSASSVSAIDEPDAFG
jgi:hypothetical protein